MRYFLLVSITCLVGCSRKPEEPPPPDLSGFTQTHLPELQDLIAELHHDIAKRKEALDTLRSEMKALGWNPDSDEDLKHWQKQVEKLREELRNVHHERERAYIAYRKYELCPETNEAAWQKHVAQVREKIVTTRKIYTKLLAERS